MKNLNKLLVLFLLLVFIATAGCSASKKGNCGCPNQKGLVGY